MHHNYLFDLDETLLDFHASEYKALGIVLRANGLPFSDEIYRAFKAYNSSLWLELEKGTITRTELFAKRFRYVFRLCGGDTAGLDPMKINDDFIRTMSVNGVPMDGALEFVKRVKENIPDARIYIATNGATVNAKGRISSTGLDRYIDGIFISEDMGVTKPDAAFFDMCLDRIGEPGSSCIMIGDSLTSDMLGAKNVSLDSVWFMPSGNIKEAMAAYDINYCASSYDELYEVLKKWSVGHGDERTVYIKDWWNKTSDSDWYRSLRTEEQINRLKADPTSAFHPAVYGLIRKYCPDLKDLRVLLPSSGDNHAAFALALMGAKVTSADISERQLEHAADIAKKLHLDIEFICDDTMKLSRIPGDSFDLVYTSNGTLSWIDDLDSMNRNICRVLKPGGYAVLYDMHPFNRPFSGEAFKDPRIVKSYHDVFPDLHWRIQDIVNSQIRSGLTVCEMAELPALDASFWYTYAELQKKSRTELEGINDREKNPLAALPAWLTLVSQKKD